MSKHNVDCISDHKRKRRNVERQARWYLVLNFEQGSPATNFDSWRDNII